MTFEEWNKDGHLEDWDAAGYSLFNKIFVDWKADREKLIEMLEKYGRHTDDCDIGFDGDPIACSCGFDAVLAEKEKV